MKRISRISIGPEDLIFGSENTAGDNVELDPMLENFLRQENRGDELILPSTKEWKEGDPVIDPTIHPRDLQEMRAHRKPAEHIEPCDKKRSDGIYKDLLEICGGSDIPDLHNILGWN